MPWRSDDIDNDYPASPPPIRAASEARAVEAQPRPDLVAKYRLFADEMRPKCDVIYHPSCGNDCSPSTAFPQSRVIYVDTDAHAVQALKKHGFDAHPVSALTYDPGEVDILIMMNPGISPTVPSSFVREKGYVLCNDYHKTASQLRGNNEFEFVGVVRKMRDESLLLDRESLEDCWEEIDTEEEFMNAPFDWGTVNYAMALPVVRAVTGSAENVLAEYKAIIAKASEAQRRENEKLLLEDPEMARTLAELFRDSNTTDEIIYRHDGQQFVLGTHFPKKKGTADDLFIFRRKTKN